MSDLLFNKVAVVTGAGSGIGCAIARQFLQEGAKVVLVGRSRETLEAVAATAPARAHVQVCDITRPEERSDLVTTTVRKFGKVDLIVPCAGLMQTTSAECETASLQEHFQINCDATFQSVTAFREQLNRQASIIFMTAGGIPTAATLLSAWLASKYALKSLALSLAQHWKIKSIRVNCLAPRPTQTFLWQKLQISQEQKSCLHDQLFRSAGEIRFMPPESVAQAATFLASDNAQGIHGQEIIVDD